MGCSVLQVLAILEETGYTEDRFYIHCDGALFGIMMSFVKDASALTFKKPIGSISVSGHKFIGTPTPCGIVMTRLRHAMALSNDVEYLNSRDATIMGSRNGQAPIQLWYTLTRKGYDGLRRDVEKCMSHARALRDMLQAAGFRAMLNDLSNTVVFERPKDEAFVRKWQLACEGDIAHAIVMPNHDISKLREFVEDYVSAAWDPAVAMTADQHCNLMTLTDHNAWRALLPPGAECSPAYPGKRGASVCRCAGSSTELPSARGAD